MITQVFTVRDDKAQAYFNPFFMQNVELAKRAIIDCMADSNHQFSVHKEDFSLWHIGAYDDSKGVVEAFERPEIVANLVDLKKGEE